MQKILLSFAVGASVSQGEFLALILKFKFEDGSESLTAWAKPKIALLLQMLMEYHQHLNQLGIHLNPDSIEKTIRNEAPILSLEEVEDLPAHAVIKTATGRVDKNNVLAITIKKAKLDQPEIFQVTQNQCEWLIGFIANTLNEFDEDGGLTIPNDLRH